MYIGKTLFAQRMDFLTWKTFHRIIDRHDADSYVKSMTCADQFRVRALAPLTYRESLRDIEVSLSAQAAKLYHMGFRHEIKRSTLADANETRDWRIHAEFAQCLITQARKFYIGDSFGIELENTAYALDSTTIDLCLSLFPCALFRPQVGGEEAYTARFERQHPPPLYPHPRRQAGRCEDSRRFVAGDRSVLRHGSRLSGLRPALRDASGTSLLRYARQVEHQTAPRLFGQDRSRRGR